ncbi:radical SAM family heme chaperone HemW [Silvibacterium dinghuense]|uniref:Heme chaperone HemW n=1 Tax=Silvibacterium dinghuense TaxID=1560006 RepID=A0A4Q1SHP8_9BACT|nr:radical SAM family heme chaperone HemW [Silvibacterium dinghuense]RXS96700.1 radical SAM family heme chaperone HemW [Silvibacterium dinghuense]GGG92969.1 coproporphyrinogen III oxidase [Silvibacterium dinghuense]
MDPVGLYISIPFCRSKCTYCNFASGVFPLAQMDRYLDRLEADLGAARDSAPWRAALPAKADSIYLGGGTPSLLSASQVDRLFLLLRRHFEVLPGAEITVECAPGQLEDATLTAMAANGVNRLSFGVQSFIDEEAKHTGRLHTRAIALEDVARVHCSGIARISLDLIAGLPGQTEASWRESVEVLIASGVNHASLYMLEIDDDSRLGREIENGGLRYYAPQVPSDEAITTMYLEGAAMLEAAGLLQYEISNFARPGYESAHNLKYWERRPYLGLGLDAHSMLRDAQGRVFRFATSSELPRFLEAPGWHDAQALKGEEELEEAWFLGLRLNRGVSLTELEAEFGTEAIEPFQQTIAELKEESLLAQQQDRICLTAKGRLLSNDVFERFLMSETEA